MRRTAHERQAERVLVEREPPPAASDGPRGVGVVAVVRGSSSDGSAPSNGLDSADPADAA